MWKEKKKTQAFTKGKSADKVDRKQISKEKVIAITFKQKIIEKKAKKKKIRWGKAKEILWVKK